MKRRAPVVNICSSQTALRVPRKKIAALVGFVARRERVGVGEVDVAVVSGREMACLNRRYLGRAGATDVLSFDLSGAPQEGLSAQLVVCGDLAVRQAKALGVGPQRELLLYVVHGLLHVMGRTDGAAGEAAKMRARQEQLLEEFLKAYRRR